MPGAVLLLAAFADDYTIIMRERMGARAGGGHREGILASERVSETYSQLIMTNRIRETERDS